MTDREEKAMRTSTRRLKTLATRKLGLRRPVDPKPSPDLRFFKKMQKISLRVAGEYIDKLLGTA